MDKPNKPKNVLDHWHWFRGGEEDRADVCVLGIDEVVIWFVIPDITVAVPSWPQAHTLLSHLGYTEYLQDEGD